MENQAQCRCWETGEPYLAGEGIRVVLLEALKANHNNLHYLDQLQGLWGKYSKWFLEMKRLNGGVRCVHAGAGRQGGQGPGAALISSLG